LLVFEPRDHWVWFIVASRPTYSPKLAAFVAAYIISLQLLFVLLIGYLGICLMPLRLLNFPVSSMIIEALKGNSRPRQGRPITILCTARIVGILAGEVKRAFFVAAE
jgi:hypothetical protein